jgi:hypothetical protein
MEIEASEKSGLCIFYCRAYEQLFDIFMVWCVASSCFRSAPPPKCQCWCWCLTNHAKHQTDRGQAGPERPGQIDFHLVESEADRPANQVRQSRESYKYR